ncbi:MAG: hypothetical protein KatS3mg015_2934 [Fimbriimonadales bacterium]|nr:MAG: hypothetical protein KatS3mg015_2934 [Fimbriimonadales bacterium]
MSGKLIENPSGAFGYTDLRTQLWAQEAAFKASAAISARRVVAIGTNGQIATAATNGTASLAIGIAQNAIASGATGMVIVQGIAEDVPCDGAVAAGDLLKRSATTAGSVAATATPAAGEVIGIAINASASNVVDVWVTKAP